jgi:hypothetical protein
MKKTFLLFAVLAIVSCEKAHFDEQAQGQSNVTLSFSTSDRDITRATVSIGDYFTKLNVQIFNADGEKVLDKVKTQTTDDEQFGQINLSLAEGTYTIVAVGHSSIKSATIKSTEMVQFTASNGEKLTDTFCYNGTITVGAAPEQHDLVMNRVSAMFRVILTDESISTQVAKMKFDYTGGSANFNPRTFEGTTKSTQAENRTAGGNTYSCYTFPYMATSGTLKVTLSALAADGTVIRSRTWTDVPVTRNKITTYRGQFFTGDEGEITQSGFGFTVNGEWEGEVNYNF